MKEYMKGLGKELMKKLMKKELIKCGLCVIAACPWSGLAVTSRRVPLSVVIARRRRLQVPCGSVQAVAIACALIALQSSRTRATSGSPWHRRRCASQHFPRTS
eukprot:7257024-Lingulodinium_polyedra.AAC.1